MTHFFLFAMPELSPEALEALIRVMEKATTKALIFWFALMVWAPDWGKMVVGWGCKRRPAGRVSGQLPPLMAGEDGGGQV